MQTTDQQSQRLSPKFAWLIGGFVLLHATMCGVRMAAPLMALHQGRGEVAAGVLVALCSIAPAFFALLIARLADRLGVVRSMGWAVVLAVLSCMLAMLWPTYTSLAIAAIATGTSAGAANVVVQSHAGRFASNATQLKQVFTWISIATGLSNFIGPFAAGMVIDHVGWQAAFLLLAVIGLASWVGFSRSGDDPSPAQPEERSTAWALWRDPLFRRLMFMNWLMASCWDLHGFIVPVFGHERGISASAIGSILGTFAVAATVIRFLTPWVAARWKEWQLILCANIVASIIFCAYPLMPSAFAMGACSALAGIALGFVQPMVMSLLHQITPAHQRSQAVAMRIMMIKVSGVTMPALFGVGGALLGASGVFWVVGVGVMAASWVGVGLRNATLPPS